MSGLEDEPGRSIWSPMELLLEEYGIFSEAPALGGVGETSEFPFVSGGADSFLEANVWGVRRVTISEIDGILTGQSKVRRFRY